MTLNRVKRIAIAAGLVGLTMAGVIRAEAHPEAVYVGEMRLDSTLFWEHDAIDSNPVHALPFAPSNGNVDRCTLPEHTCTIYEFQVLDANAYALRVGFDTPERDDNFEIAVESPSGTRTRMINPNAYSVEGSIPRPEVGVWHIYVAPYSAEDAPYRMRAKLESKRYAPTPDANGYLLPNLVVTRTWEFGFAAPVNPLNGPFLAPDDANPPLAAGPIHPVSCSADETVDDGVTKCLRYSFGMGNAGDGAFDVRWIGDTTGTKHDVVQCVTKAGGAVEAHAAGTGSYHLTHGHWHYDDIIWHQLFKVGADHELIPAGKAKKIGYSPADEAIVQWDQFTQDRAGSSATAGNCLPGSNQRLGMSRGWGDSYRYQRAGNYVDFNVNGDGEFVVQTIVDPLGHLMETNKADNTFYTHIRVTGDQVVVLEKGYGQSPWDPAKVVVPDWWAK